MSNDIGLFGLGVMGQNLALNIAEKGFKIAVNNRSPAKVEECVARAKKELKEQNLTGYKDMKDFVASIRKPRAVIILVKAGKPVDLTIEKLVDFMEEGDIIIDGGNEWFPNTVRRAKALEDKKIQYMGMGVSGGEEGARNGPSMMPGGPEEAYKRVEPILKKCAAQVNDGPCVTWIGPGGAGNYVKMVHNGIEYGDMQLIAEAYDLMKNIAGMSNDELGDTFAEWNKGELQSFLIEITSIIMKKKTEDGKDYVLDKILDKTGMKGTGRWTVQEGAEQSVPLSVIAAALDGRYLSGLKDERKSACKILTGPSPQQIEVEKKKLVGMIRDAMYTAKICSYAQGMALIKKAGERFDWKLNLGEIARIWKGGCIIRAIFLDRIKGAFDKNAALPSLLVDPDFSKDVIKGQEALRSVVKLAIDSGISCPAFSAALSYYDSYRRERLPANLTQAQRDFFGAHTYERVDKPAGEWFHTAWTSAHISAAGQTYSLS
uniref:6-phosphogluconate dehydrogenase, decarboxylating n=1 Tax=Lotharella oceanica TaxID=641309 RepID=A0A7S2TMZ6_9EUKA|mmetsp:Transcript_20099/g.37763  ORF Transcript_20099/g.37763 Transcript_20099/m.37763 type:complete len:488 (+) Transcript_20099:93-1556(+)